MLSFSSYLKHFQEWILSDFQSFKWLLLFDDRFTYILQGRQLSAGHHSKKQRRDPELQYDLPDAIHLFLLVLCPSLLIDKLSKLSWWFRHMYFCSETCVMGSPYPCPQWLAGSSLTRRLRATALDCQVNSQNTLAAHMKLGVWEQEGTVYATVIRQCLDQ